ncbi:DUF3299 domain-containing protein [Rubinisphaera sp.]|uniref:DUF3299 domain-containing protein n=1 Tax=Rubinisphaera sp. TaxID=2024857 RepID=UPI000C10B38E|nr:DUF3299 domain-containing protein [Rubinisphaera sp.]MBV09741.1 hypothetical protein [Rubinisphaera sp.]|tara:strand:+ start:575 stop:1282 length:708 start_codon:yes stop_codon:yes gene_type:complete
MSTMAPDTTFTPQDLQSNEFDYRPTPVIVPVAVVLALVSASSLLGIVGVILAVIGFVVSLVAVWTITMSDGAYSGKWAALVAMVLSLGFGIAGMGSQIYAYSVEVPEGYRRTSFSQEISAKGFAVEEGKIGLHPDVAKLVDKPIFLKGYMYPQRQTKGLSQFLLLKDTGECCFGGQPKATDMILIKMQDEAGADYTQSRVAVAGTLKLTSDTTPEGLQPVYSIEAVKCERSRSAF